MIAINDSWRLFPAANVLYACDYEWWEKKSGVPEFKGVKISQDPKIDRYRPRWGIRRVKVVRNQDMLLTGTLGVIGWGGNSGFQALNLAVQFGARRIALVGYDMRLDLGSHWHGAHGQGLNNPTAPNVDRWRRVTDAASEIITMLGVQVFNLSPISSLVNFPKMSLDEVLSLSNARMVARGTQESDTVQ